MKRRRTITIIRTRLIMMTALAMGLVAAACSLVNSFDDVKPQTEGTYTPAVPVGEGGFLLDEAGAVDGGMTGPAGLIVVGGETMTDAGERKFVIMALDPATGREIGTREEMTVAAIRYDGLRDLWYVFESKSADFVPGPNDAVVLHVRAFDTATGKWTDRALISVPPLQSYDSIGVVRDRIAYVAHPVVAGGNPRVISIDTSNPTSPVILDQIETDRAPLGVIATRSVTGPGGVVNLVRVNTATAACTNNICPIEIVRVLFPNAGPAQVAAPVNVGLTPRNALPGYGTFSLAERDMIVVPRPVADASTTVSLFDPRNQNRQDVAASSFFITDSTLRRAAVSECTRTAFVIGTNGDFDVHAIPVFGDGGGTPTNSPTGHSGQAVYFEPATKTVLAPFGQGAGFDYSAFRLTGTPEAPGLVRRTAPDWTPPSDVRPILLGVREPQPVQCP